MNEELAAIKAAMDNLDFATARDLSTVYVNAHPDEFTDYVQMVENAETERAAMQAVVDAVEAVRNAGLVGQQYRAEAFIQHRWDPQDIGGTSEPVVRNPIEPTVRN